MFCSFFLIFVFPSFLSIYSTTSGCNGIFSRRLDFSTFNVLPKTRLNSYQVKVSIFFPIYFIYLCIEENEMRLNVRVWLSRHRRIWYLHLHEPTDQTISERKIKHVPIKLTTSNHLLLLIWNPFFFLSHRKREK